MKRLENLTKDELWALRKEIVLGSIYYSDFRNSFGIHQESAYDFFEGYEGHIVDEMHDAGLRWSEETDDEWQKKYREYDNKTTLYDWWCINEDLSWVEYTNYSVWMNGEEEDYDLTKAEAIKKAEELLLKTECGRERIEVGYHDEDGEFFSEPAEHTSRWFAEKLAEKFTETESAKILNDLATDFERIVECGYINGYYGYGIGEVLKTNSTAMGLLTMAKDKERMKKAVLACSAAGYYQCAGDFDYIFDTMDNALKEI